MVITNIDSDLYRTVLIMHWQRHTFQPRVVEYPSSLLHQHSSLVEFLLLAELFLDNEAMNRVRDFEEACLELYLRDKESERQLSSTERLREVAERSVRSIHHFWLVVSCNIKQYKITFMTDIHVQYG